MYKLNEKYEKYLDIDFPSLAIIFLLYLLTPRLIESVEIDHMRFGFLESVCDLPATDCFHSTSAITKTSSSTQFFAWYAQHSFLSDHARFEHSSRNVNKC